MFLRMYFKFLAVFMIQLEEYCLDSGWDDIKGLLLIVSFVQL